SGIVQGIGFRPFVYRMAHKLAITGFVRNQGDAGVLIVAEGDKTLLEKFIILLQEEKPYLAKYETFEIKWKKFQDEYASFTIKKSSHKTIGGISYIPPDISICDDCLEDIFNPHERRYNYAFTSCAICGPRFTTITSLPYDRPNTTMNDFPLCSDCLKEYTDPLNRRHHAQTTCCPKCGPKMSLFDKNGKQVLTKDIYKTVADFIKRGKIVAIKGIGGTHLACSVLNDKTILRLRTRKGDRKNKPFALISQSLTDVRKFAYINDKEEQLLTSFRRPIVLLEKKVPFPLSKWISPNLFNVGVMLPYSGIHYLLLKEINGPAIILTSANPTNLPMFINNQKILSQGEELADYFLLHNREIYQRADDSVTRITNNTPALLRRSRGWVPEPVNLPFDFNAISGIGVGSMLTNTGALIKRDRCFPTQFIGDVETIETLDFLENAIRHLQRLLGLDDFSYVVNDLHPRYLTKELAKKFVKEFQASQYQLQHHFAHAIALMAESQLPIDDEAVIIIADGVGYGGDENIWGGEIFHCTYQNYTRVGHLEEQIMIGGDKATYYPMRMAIGILSNVMSSKELFSLISKNYRESLPNEIDELHVILAQLEKKINLYNSTSTGRILAATSALLKACYERTFEGEPALILESLAHKGRKGKVTFTLPSPEKGIINTTSLIHQVLQKIQQGKKAEDIALATELALAKQFSRVAINYAKENSVTKIGFTGGVAYNEVITSEIARQVKNADLRFLQHKELPCGDGCISSGQVIYGGLKEKMGW
ncbi:MAG: carbamoyltransferase HypF, partial [Asgard group archaeon]|nr:carbamoyltransferase HypF [Asgard group archaeon]